MQHNYSLLFWHLQCALLNYMLSSDSRDVCCQICATSTTCKSFSVDRTTLFQQMQSGTGEVSRRSTLPAASVGELGVMLELVAACTWQYLRELLHGGHLSYKGCLNVLNS